MSNYNFTSTIKALKAYDALEAFIDKLLDGGSGEGNYEEGMRQLRGLEMAAAVEYCRATGNSASKAPFINVYEMKVAVGLIPNPMTPEKYRELCISIHMRPFVCGVPGCTREEAIAKHEAIHGTENMKEGDDS